MTKPRSHSGLGSAAPPTLTQILADFAISTREADIAPQALDHAKMSLTSTIASAAAGYHIASTGIIRKLELADGGTPSTTVWFHGGRLPLARAARVNAFASDAAASDDSDMRGIAHIGTIAAAVGLAAGEVASLVPEEPPGALIGRLAYRVFRSFRPQPAWGKRVAREPLR